MPFNFLENIATADVAFKAWGKTCEEVFTSSAEALMHVMVEDLSAIALSERRTMVVQESSVEMLLFNFLQEFIFFKDAESLLLKVMRLDIRKEQGEYQLRSETAGERIDPARHALKVDVKAVTLHRFDVRQTPDGWEATVVLDI